MLRKQTRVSRRGRKPSAPSLKLRRSPLQARSAETIAVILEASTQILETRGLAAFNTNAVAERAGVSVGSLYQYFPGKEAILAALHRRYEERLLHAVMSSLTATHGKELSVRIPALVNALIDAHMFSPALHRILESEESRISAEGETVSSIGSAVHKNVVRMLREHKVRISGVSIPEAAEDLSRIARALIDAALANNTGVVTTRHRRRIARALLAYLHAD
jgi:AcrR family transcriptional regulator